MQKLQPTVDQIKKQQSSTSSIKHPEQRQLDLAAALFKKFTAILGNKWTNQFHTAKDAQLSMSEWALGIADLTDDELAHGVDQVRLTCTWPPSIAEFRDLCRPKDHWQQRKWAAAARVPHSRRLKNKPDMKKAAAAIAKLYGVLGKEKKSDD